MKSIINYKDIKNQIGCGYCSLETICKKYDSKINKAKLGCKEFTHYSKLDIKHQLN